MNDRLTVGVAASGAAVSLPRDVATQTTAILGIRGSGKTNTAGVITEELLERGVPVAIIDPLDVWWGLKSSADGSAPGFPVTVLGGPHGDLPLREEDGEILADFTVEARAPLVLSLRHLRKAAQRRFVTAFAERLYHRKGEAEHRVPLLVVIDEADSFVPQRVGGGEARMVGAIEDLVRRGRAAGIGVVLISQRAASVNKDVLTQLELLVAHRHTSPQDRKALDEWVRAHDTEDRRDAFMDELASLPVGAAWFWSPTLDVFERLQVRLRNTFDSSATPAIGERAAVPESFAAVDLEALQERLRETVEEAEATDPKRLQKRIEELEAELRRTRSSAEPDPEVIVRAVEEVRTPLLRHIVSLTTKVEGAADISERLVAMLRNGDSPPVAVETEPKDAKPVTAPPSPQQSAPRAPPGGGTLSAPRQRILDALARFEAVGVPALARSNAAVFSQQSPKSSAYGAHVAALLREGLLEGSGSGSLALTDQGRQRAARAEPIRSLQELHESWFRYLPDPQVRMLRALIGSYPAPFAREELAEAANQSPKSSAYGAHVAELSSLGLAWYPEPGDVAATELLFPEGLK